MACKRYNCQGSSGYMSESDDGEYVTTGDYVQLALLLRQYVNAYPAFRSRPVGAPYSVMRLAQEEDIAREDAARKHLTGWASGE